jgi:hypothetical protein
MILGFCVLSKHEQLGYDWPEAGLTPAQNVSGDGEGVEKPIPC